MQVEDDGAVEAAAFVVYHEVDAGQVVKLAAPDADEFRYVLNCRRVGGLGEYRKRCERHEKGESV